MEAEKTNFAVLFEFDGVSSSLRSDAGPAAARQGRLSAQRDIAALPVGGDRRRGLLHRHRPFRPIQAGASAAVSALRKRHAGARSSGRHLRHARRRGLSALLRRLGHGDDRMPAGRRCHRRQDLAALLRKKDAKEPIHMVSAFAARQRLVLGQIKVNEKSNEITAIPALHRDAGDRRRRRHHRRHGLPARHRREDPGQEGRLHLLAQRAIRERSATT